MGEDLGMESLESGRSLVGARGHGTETTVRDSWDGVSGIWDCEAGGGVLRCCCQVVTLCKDVEGVEGVASCSQADGVLVEFGCGWGVGVGVLCGVVEIPLIGVKGAVVL